MAPRAQTRELAGRTVNRIGFGAMQLPGRHVWGPPQDREQAIAVLQRAVELVATRGRARAPTLGHVAGPHHPDPG